MAKLHSRGILVVDEYGCVKVNSAKQPEFVRHEFSSYLGGRIKYLDLAESARVRVTIELLEDGEE